MPFQPRAIAQALSPSLDQFAINATGTYWVTDGTNDYSSSFIMNATGIDAASVGWSRERFHQQVQIAVAATILANHSLVIRPEDVLVLGL